MLLAWKVHRVRTQQDVVRWVTDAGGNIRYDYEFDANGTFWHRYFHTSEVNTDLTLTNWSSDSTTIMPLRLAISIRSA